MDSFLSQVEYVKASNNKKYDTTRITDNRGVLKIRFFDAVKGDNEGSLPLQMTI
ncbi:hypothetical protein AwDysgo_14770 [Bacteroidales bacterium]|nr:hypothetical protein AwDysgo_14770 [Bacteroidales bacterium]